MFLDVCSDRTHVTVELADTYHHVSGESESVCLLLWECSYGLVGSLSICEESVTVAVEKRIEA